MQTENKIVFIVKLKWKPQLMRPLTALRQRLVQHLCPNLRWIVWTADLSTCTDKSHNKLQLVYEFLSLLIHKIQIMSVLFYQCHLWSSHVKWYLEKLHYGWVNEGWSFCFSLLFIITNSNIQCVSKKKCMWKCAILINNCSICSAVFYMIFTFTKLALKYPLFHRISFCQSRDMLD